MYTTAQIRWELPNNEEVRNSRAHVVNKEAGRRRYADYLVVFSDNVPLVLGEAKCYRTDQTTSDTKYWWNRYVAFATQLADYAAKSAAVRRAGGRSTFRYHFCQAYPRWVTLLVAPLVADNTDQSLEVDPIVPPRDLVQVPVCANNRAVTDALFACTVEGVEDDQEGVPSCLSSWYDYCAGSE